MKKQKILNIVLAVLAGILACILLGITIYNKIDEKNRKYSYDKMLKVYNEIKYDDKLNIYLFYGKECPHCENELKFFKNIDSEYKSIYNFYKFEVWHNENTAELRKRVIDKLVEEGYVTGTEDRPLESYYKSVPCLIIGNEVLIGYSTNSDDVIKQMITEQKENDYDIMKKIDLK